MLRKTTKSLLSANLSNNLHKSVLKCLFCTESNPHYDVIITGGGMVGSTMACAIAENQILSEKKVLLLEGRSQRPWKLKEDYGKRVSAINYQTKNLMESLGAWKYISDARYAEVKRMQIWDACSDAMITFQNDDTNDNIAFIVENDLIVAAVCNQFENNCNVDVKYGSKVKKYELPCEDLNAPVKIEMEDGSNYTCNLLIGADGVNSKLRKTMGVHCMSWNYDQMGVVATVKLSETAENSVAWQRFLPTGPIALLPLTNELSSLIWTTTTHHARNLLTLPNELFVDQLNEALWKVYPRVPIIDQCTNSMNKLLECFSLNSNAVRQLHPSVTDVMPNSRAAFPLAFGHASNYITPRAALIGDAAHRIHPLAGQGANLGFGDVSCLVDVLSEAIYNGSDIGDIKYLRKFERERQIHNVPTAFACDGLHKLYGTTFTPVVLVRSLGLQVTNSLLPVKRLIMQHAA